MSRFSILLSFALALSLPGSFAAFLVDRREENGGEAKWEPARSHLIVVANHLIGRFGVFPGSAAAAP